MQNVMITDTKTTGVIVPSRADRMRIIRRIVKEHDVSGSRAEAMLSGVIAFLQMCSAHSHIQFVPSPAVDDAWHTFLIYTRVYRKFCASVGRAYIDHEPNDGATVSVGGYGRTIRFMDANQITYDRTLWDASAGADCVPDPCTCEAN